MKVRHFNNKISSKNEDFEFNCIAHKATSEENLLLDPVNFYQKYTGAIPKGEHYEMELETEVWNHPNKEIIHYHFSEKTQKNFVCWINQITSIEDAYEIFSVWCVGTVYAMIYGNDFAKIQVESKTTENFLKRMQSEYQIKIVKN